jgi:hypothetical protein
LQCAFSFNCIEEGVPNTDGPFGLVNGSSVVQRIEFLAPGGI